MKLPTCRKAFNNHLRALLADLGFAAKGLSFFTRPNPLGTEILRLPDRREPDRCLFSLIVGVSVHAVEQIIRPESKDLLSTIWVPIHFLHADREFFEWTMRSEDDALSVTSAIMEEVHTYVLPFFETYTNIKAIKSSLESSDPRDGFALGPQQIACVLAAMEYVGGDVARAFEVLEDAIEFESAKPISRDRHMKSLLADLHEREALRQA